MMVSFILPVSWDYWYWKCLWALLLGAPALLLSRRKNRSTWGWAILCGLLGFLLGFPGIAALVILATRKKLSMRMKYLTLKFEEDLAQAMKLPSLVGNDIEKRILMVLANNPRGLRMGALAQGLGSDWRHIHDIVEHMRSKGKIRKDGERYFFNLD